MVCTKPGNYLCWWAIVERWMVHGNEPKWNNDYFSFRLWKGSLLAAIVVDVRLCWYACACVEVLSEVLVDSWMIATIRVAVCLACGNRFLVSSIFAYWNGRLCILTATLPGRSVCSTNSWQSSANWGSCPVRLSPRSTRKLNLIKIYNNFLGHPFDFEYLWNVWRSKRVEFRNNHLHMVMMPVWVGLCICFNVCHMKIQCFSHRWRKSASEWHFFACFSLFAVKSEWITRQNGCFVDNNIPSRIG